jgi:hypothetical protein
MQMAAPVESPYQEILLGQSPGTLATQLLAHWYPDELAQALEKVY